MKLASDMIQEDDSSKEESTPKLPKQSKVFVNKNKIGCHLVLNQIEMNDSSHKSSVPSYVSSIILAELQMLSYQTENYHKV